MSVTTIRKAQGRRLSEARHSAGYKSAREAALANSWPESSYRAHETGTRTIGQDDAERYARRFRAKGVKIEASTILFGEDGPELKAASVPLRGYAGADSRPDVVVFSDVQGDLDDDIPIPPDATPGTVAVEVRGNSMRSIAKDGWLIYFDEGDVREGPLAIEALYGELCIVWLEDGRILFKELHAGKMPGYCLLISMNDDPLPDEMVMKATRVTFIAPRGKRPSSDTLLSLGRRA